MKHALTKHIRPHLVVFLFVAPLVAQRPTPDVRYDLQFLEAASGTRDALAAQRVARRADPEGLPVLSDFNDTETIEVHLLADGADPAALVCDERRRYSVTVIFSRPS